MSKRVKRRARERRIELMMVLGYACVKCGAEDDLEFDCIEPQGDHHHRMDTSHRMCFYWRQYRAGNLQILCSKCHNIKTADDLEKQEQQPF